MWEKSASCTLELDARHALLSRPLHQHLQQDKIRDSADCDGDVATAGFGNGETRGCTPRPSPQQQKDTRTPSTYGHWACQTPPRNSSRHTNPPRVLNLLAADGTVAQLKFHPALDDPPVITPQRLMGQVRDASSGPAPPAPRRCLPFSDSRACPRPRSLLKDAATNSITTAKKRMTERYDFSLASCEWPWPPLSCQSPWRAACAQSCAVGGLLVALLRCSPRAHTCSC